MRDRRNGKQRLKDKRARYRDNSPKLIDPLVPPWEETEDLPFDESDDFARLPDLYDIKGAIDAVFYDRVSDVRQEEKGNLEARYSAIMDEYGHMFNIKKYLCEQAHAPSNRLDERKALKKAIKYAKKHNLPIIAPSVDRFVRSDMMKARKDVVPLADIPSRFPVSPVGFDVIWSCVRSPRPKNSIRLTRRTKSSRSYCFCDGWFRG